MERLKEHERQFVDEVFPAELSEIRRRRHDAGDPRPLPGGAEVTGPSTALGLVGLAFSGGGIRSASFCLGVVQHLIKRRLFQHVDYLSTVSGGGFTGACLSALMHRDPAGADLLVTREGAAEPTALNHVRNGSNYLLPPGLLNGLRLPAVIITGAVRTLFLLLPAVVLAVFVTELFFELTGRFLPAARRWVPILGIAPLLLAVFVRPMLMIVRRGRSNWATRDRAGRRLGGYLLLAGCSLVAVPLLVGLDLLVVSSPDMVYEWIRQMVSNQVELGFRGWLFWGVPAAAVLVVFGWWRFKTGLLVAGFGAVGPVGLLVFYLSCCLYNINSPVVSGSPAVGLVRALQAGQSDQLLLAARDVLVAKRHRGSGFYSVTSFDVSLVVLERDENAPTSRLPDVLTSYREPVLHVRVPEPSCLEAGDCQLLIDELLLTRGHAEWWFYLSGLLLFLYNCLFVNLNAISMHGFYRDRLSRTFLIARGEVGLESADRVKLSELGGEGSPAPYHLVNTALNLQGSDDPQLRDRKTASYVLAKRYCGGHYSGHCPTDRMEELDRGLDLGTAMAISGAAAAPNMGAITMRSLAFVLTMLNIRLNYWLPNPAHVDSWRLRLGWHPGLRHLLQEALGVPDDSSAYVNCSDGGHIENLGVYELVKRRCGTIICVDGEADGSFSFHGFTTMQRQVEIDFGARIEIDVRSIVPDDTGTSRTHYVVGRILYSDGEQGTLVYLKLSCIGDEPQYLAFYRNLHPTFPHESTSDQFFEETQFEVYRALGEHGAEGAVEVLSS